jgi:hypothetical protein
LSRSFLIPCRDLNGYVKDDCDTRWSWRCIVQRWTRVLGPPCEMESHCSRLTRCYLPPVDMHVNMCMCTQAHAHSRAHHSDRDELSGKGLGEGKLYLCVRVCVCVCMCVCMCVTLWREATFCQPKTMCPGVARGFYDFEQCAPTIIRCRNFPFTYPFRSRHGIKKLRDKTCRGPSALHAACVESVIGGVLGG